MPITGPVVSMVSIVLIGVGGGIGFLMQGAKLLFGLKYFSTQVTSAAVSDSSLRVSVVNPLSNQNGVSQQNTVVHLHSRAEAADLTPAQVMSASMAAESADASASAVGYRR
jgi:hypothetical protein